MRLRHAKYAGHSRGAGELACKPDSVPRRRGLGNGGAAATIHLDTPLPGASSGLPADSGEQPSNACAAALSCGLLDLASGGVCLATPVTRNAGALLPHRFTLTTTRVAVYFLWHFPASHLGLLLAITLLCEVRTFLDSTPDLSDQHEPRPPGQLVRDDQRYSLRNPLTSNSSALTTAQHRRCDLRHHRCGPFTIGFTHESASVSSIVRSTGSGTISITQMLIITAITTFAPCLRPG
jgi:hypothetical protein